MLRTNRQTNKQTERQTDGLVNPTHADRKNAEEKNEDIELELNRRQRYKRHRDADYNNSDNYVKWMSNSRL